MKEEEEAVGTGEKKAAQHHPAPGNSRRAPDEARHEEKRTLIIHCNERFARTHCCGEAFNA